MEDVEEFDEDAFVLVLRSEPYRLVQLVPVEPSVGDPVRAVGHYWADPRPERVLSSGHHCVVRMFVGEWAFRATLDTGSAKPC